MKHQCKIYIDPENSKNTLMDIGTPPISLVLVPLLNLPPRFWFPAAGFGEEVTIRLNGLKDFHRKVRGHRQNSGLEGGLVVCERGVSEPDEDEESGDATGERSALIAGEGGIKSQSITVLSSDTLTKKQGSV